MRRFTLQNAAEKWGKTRQWADGIARRLGLGKLDIVGGRALRTFSKSEFEQIKPGRMGRPRK